MFNSNAPHGFEKLPFKGQHNPFPHRRSQAAAVEICGGPQISLGALRVCEDLGLRVGKTGLGFRGLGCRV